MFVIEPRKQLDLPTFLKVKVSLIIRNDIQFHSLAGRIDVNLSRFTKSSIASGTARLRYQNGGGTLILIDSDESFHQALLDWQEHNLKN